jgi:asparagine synthase (glutamine-hydrolysing)
MCGILGYVGNDYNREQFERALESMSHRGPDGAGTFVKHFGEKIVALGHRRLAIIDLSSMANQPMSTPDNRYIIVFNGEIYNYKDLRAELESIGITFRTNSDTEVLLWALVKWGKDCLTRLDGIFAFAFLNNDTGDLILARDQLGVKPLYYSEYHGNFVFASEVKALLHLGVKPCLRREMAGEYLANLWVMEPDTLFKDIYILPAGSFIEFSISGNIKKGVFWEPTLETRSYRNESEALEELIFRLKRAIKSQMVADVPVGSYISGGVDSSIVSILASKLTDRDLITVGARFDKKDKAYEAIPDDGKYIDLIVKKNPRFKHTDVILFSEMYEEYKKLIYFMDVPIADPAMVPAFLLAKEARKHGAIVMLSGMGGDELFGGYKRYEVLNLVNSLSQIPETLKLFLLTLSILAQKVNNGTIRKYAKDLERLFNLSRGKWPLSYINISGHFSAIEINNLLSNNVWQESFSFKLNNLIKERDSLSLLKQAQLIDLKGFLASHNLIYVDKASMAASVEVRVPLMNVELTEFAFSLPDQYKVRGLETKRLLKRACAKIAGPEFAYRPKAGFAMPIRSWLNGPLREELKSIILSPEMKDIFNENYLNLLISEHLNGKRENTWKLWSLMTLSLWIKTFNVSL